MDKIILQRRVDFNLVIQSSDYTGGEKIIKQWLNEDLQDLQENCLTSARYAETWGMLQRLRFITGDIVALAQALSDEEVKPAGPENVEVVLVKAHLAYHHSRLLEAYDLVMHAFRKQNWEKQPETHAAVRLLLLAAKCSWRRDDFPLALRRLGLAAYYLRVYQFTQPQEFKYANFLEGRLLTVYARLLTERRGISDLGKSNSELSLEFLDAAIAFFSKNCPLQDTNGRPLDHFFVAEIYELYALTYCNLAREEPAVKASPVETGPSSGCWKDANDYNKKARKILRRQLKGKPSRRIAHLDRIAGETCLREVIKAGRKLERTPRHQSLCRKAIECFKKEAETRKLAGIKGSHITRAQLYNNCALAYSLLGHGYCNYPDQVDHQQARKEFQKARKYALKALKANGLPKKQHSLVKELARGGGLANSQTLLSIGCIMEAELRLAFLRQEAAIDTYQNILSWYKIANGVEDRTFTLLQSNSAKEDVGRLTHPIYECFLEAYWSVQQDNLVTKEDHEILLSAFRRVIAPQMWDFAHRAKRDHQVGKDDKVLALDELAASIMEALKKRNNSVDLAENAQRLLENAHYDASASTINGVDGNLKHEGTVNDFIKSFTIVAGAMVVYFSGNRHLYALTFGGIEEKVIAPISLVKFGQDEPYVYVNKVKQAKRKRKRLDDRATKIVNRRNHRNTSTSVTEKKEGKDLNDETVKLANQVAANLFQLYQLLIPPLQLDPEIPRFYIIPDRSLWGLPWSTFLLEKPPVLVNPKDERTLKFLIQHRTFTLHASLNLWLDRSNQKANVNEGRQMVGVITNDYYHDFKSGIEDVFYKFTGVSASFLEMGGQADNRASLAWIKEVDAVLPSFREALQNANLIGLIGHTARKENHPQFRIGFIISEGEEEGEDNPEPNPRLFFSQAEIESLDMRGVEMVLLLTCNGGIGHTVTGNAPRALFRAFLHAGVANITYCGETVYHSTATTFGKKYQQKCNSHPFGEAYSLTMREMLTESIENEKEWSLLKNLGDIKFIGNQVASFQSL